MDSSRKVMESFDSLWFFNNVLSLSTFQQKIHQTSAEDIVKEEEPFKPKAQNLQTEAPSTGILVPRWCPNCGEIEQPMAQEQPVKEVESAKPTERGEKRSRRRRRKRSKRKILGELDLVFHGDHLPSQPWSPEETYVCDQSFETQHYTKMPPLNDGLAMKEHLKSWAYAVACRVR